LVTGFVFHVVGKEKMKWEKKKKDEYIHCYNQYEFKICNSLVRTTLRYVVTTFLAWKI